MQKESAPNYYPPLLRKQMNEFMNKTSINMNGPIFSPSSQKRINVEKPAEAEL
jgi:hypothetical protein